VTGKTCSGFISRVTGLVKQFKNFLICRYGIEKICEPMPLLERVGILEAEC
jgi:hypothetical protein